MSFNVNAYNANGYNVSPVFSEAAPTSLLTFDDFNCHDQVHMTIEKVAFNSGHKRDIDRFAVPRSHGIRVANVYEREKVIKATGFLRADDSDALESYMDTMKAGLRGKRRQLVTRWGGKTRLYQHATLINPDEIFPEREHYHISFIPFTLQFLCEGFSTNWLYEQWGKTITAAEDTVGATGEGTQEGKPVIVIVFSAASGVTELTVQIDENSQLIGYAGSISAGDVLIFDCEEDTVTKNGIETDFIGYFPEMAIGPNTFRITTNGASRTYRATIKTKHAHL